MDANQITVLKDSYNKEATRPDGSKSTLGEYMRFITDFNVEFVSSKDMVLYDDANDMIHCVCVNEDAYSQANFPVKIISTPYDHVHGIETIMSRDNFEAFLDNGFFSNTNNWSDEKKEFMKKWANGLKIQAQQLPYATPFYTDTAGTMSMPSMPNVRNDGITTINSGVSSASKTITSAKNEDEIINAIKAGKSVILKKDITMTSEPLTITGDTAINLNGHALTGASGKRAVMIKSGNVTITNGTITGIGNDAIMLNGVVADGGAPCSLTLGDDVKVIADDCAVFMKGPDAVLNTSGYLESKGGKYAAIQGNGIAGDIVVNITGGEIVSKDVAIYFPCKTTLNISGNAKITGSTGVYHKSGRLIITGGEITGNGDKADYVHNNNGCDSTGDALVIEACNYPDGVPVVTIMGGKFNSVNASAVGYYQESEKYAMSNEKFITGGAFNTNVSKYIADNYYQNSNGKVVRNYQ